MDIDLNKSNCITYVTRLFEYEYINVCNGLVTKIAWGFAEYLIVALLATAIMSFILIILFITHLDVMLFRKMLRNKDR